MGLGSTAKKIQKLADTAEDLYKRLNEVRNQLIELQETVTDTSERVAAIETESAEQRAILEAIAEEQGVDTDAVVDAADLTDPDQDAEATADPADEGTPETESGTASE